MRIAIVEDDITLGNHIGKKLQRSGYETIISNSLEEFKSSTLSDADLFIIDIGLGDGSGFDIVKWLREDVENSCPIIIMSGYGEIEKKLKGFDLGIDDYLTKPVVPEELVARVSALLRRGSTIKKAKVDYKDYSFNFNTKQLNKGEYRLDLTRKELQIVEFFLLNKNRVVNKNELIKSVWGQIDLLDVTYNTINVTICKMRKKLGDSFDLQTVPGIGYILNA